MGAVGQGKPVVHVDHEWGGQQVWDPAWDASSLGTEILSDDLSIRFRNNKPQFIAVFFERRRVVRYANAEDIRQYGPVVLPESLDEPFDEATVPWASRGKRVYPLLFNMRVDHFNVRIIRPDGTWTELPVGQRAAKGFMGSPVAMQATMSVTHYPQGIMPGDVVEYHWKYMLPWDSNAPYTSGWRQNLWVDNWARLGNWRVFFHGALPIREQRIELLYHSKHGMRLGGEAPKDLRMNGEERIATWDHHHLPGVMHEVNARPGSELPFIAVTFTPDDLRYIRRERLSGLPIQQPHWLQAIRQREAKAVWWRRVARKRVPDRQNALIKRFIERTCAGIPDSLAPQRMEALHERIARDFQYQDDRDWYVEIDQGLARMGDQVKDERLRQISRYDLYSKLLNALRIEHVTAYVLDKRAGRLTDQFTTPMWDNEFIFGIKNGPDMLWMHPKRARHGWFADELPFYWQGSEALLIDLQRLVGDDPRPPLFVELPTDDPASNVRAIEYSLRVDLDEVEASGEARIFLSGQFSTLGRAAFLGASIDSTVHPNYGHRPRDILGVGANRQDDPDLSDVPPFRYREKEELVLAGFRKEEQEGSYAFNLSPFLAHAVPTGILAEGRDLPFHWDFRQADRFIVDIEFEQPVEVMDLTRLQESSSTPGARYDIEATRIDARHVRIESRFTVTHEQEEVGSAIAIEELIRTITDPDRMIRVRRSRLP